MSTTVSIVILMSIMLLVALRIEVDLEFARTQTRPGQTRSKLEQPSTKVLPTTSVVSPCEATFERDPKGPL